MSAVSGRRVVSPTLVGRDAELETLVAAARTPPAVVTLRGDAGVGKTRLVAELAERPEVAGRHWAIGYARRIREPFPLGTVTEAIRGLGEALGSTTYSPVAGALRPLLPEVARWLPPPLPPLDDRAGERHRVFRGLVDVLAALGPTVLVLEDLHWADAQTPEFLGYLLADPPPRLTVLLTHRTGEGAALVRATTAQIPAAMTRADVTLTPLDQDQTGALTARILDQPQITAEFAGYIWEQTSGVPFAVEELVALLQERGALVHQGEGWVRKRLESLEAPAGIRAQVLERVGVLSDDARAVVRAAAVLQSPTPVPALLATCLIDEYEARRGLDEALDAGVLVTENDLVGFRHLLAALAVYEAISRPGQQELHGRAVDALEALDPVPLGRLAYHLHQSGRSDEWASVAERAADQAAELGHDAEAARLLEDVLRGASLDGARQAALAIKLAKAASETLHVTDRLTDLLAEVLDHDLPAAIRGELRLRLALLHEAAGADPARVRRLYVTATQELDDRPDLKAWAMMGLGIHTAVGVPMTEHRHWVQQVIETLPDTSPSAFQTFLLGKAAMELVTFGDPDWPELVGRLERQTGGAPRNRHEVNAYQSVGMAACYAGHYHHAARLLSRGLDSPVTRENRKLELRMRSALALLDYSRGRWEGLADTIDRLLEELADYPLARVDIEVAAGCLALAHGQVRRARERLSEVVTEATTLGAYELVAPAVDALGRLAAGNRAAEDAVEPVRAFVAAVTAKGFWMPAVRALSGVTLVLVTTGHAAEAAAFLERCTREVDALDAPLAPATVPHASGWLDAAAGRQPDAVDHFLVAADRYDAVGCPYEAAQAREAAGGCRLETGTPGGVGPLRAALTTYQQLGAGWDRDRAAGLARRHGVSVPTLHRGGRQGYHDQLSPREREVAILVATGRTNKEIARDLYISPRTVEKHISAALRKLDLRTRAGLAGHIEEVRRADGQG